MWLDSSHKWLLINDDEDESRSYNDTEINTIMFDKDRNKTLVDKLGNLNISVDADIVVATRGKFLIIGADLKEFPRKKNY